MVIEREERSDGGDRRKNEGAIRSMAPSFPLRSLLPLFGGSSGEEISGGVGKARRLSIYWRRAIGAELVDGIPSTILIFSPILWAIAAEKFVRLLLHGSTFLFSIFGPLISLMYFYK